ncbi:MAG: heavy metal sensor histidine kinase [Planctomycetia bacterium]|nr:heavy metal sensor histidine kinase [Planctomycetia bacterium]
MIRSVTVRWRMTLWFGAALAVILLGFGATTYFVMRHHLLERVDAGLNEELSDVLSEIQRGNDRAAMLGWLDRRFARHEGFDFQVTTPAGERVFANLRLGERRLPIPALGDMGEDSQYETYTLPGAGRDRIVTRTAQGPDGPLVVQVARSLNAVDRELVELLTALLIAGPLALGLTVAGGYFLARQALAPVDRMTAAANQIDAPRFGRRLDVVNPDDELGRLGNTLNSMLDRLERSFDEMRRFTADASHELRTPLSVIRNEAEVALGKPISEAEKQELLGSILEECERLTWVTDQLLTLSREDAGIAPNPREPVDISQLMRGVTDTMRPLAEGKGQRLATNVNGPVILHADPARLRHVIYNLVDNAIKYTPPHGTVNVTVATRDHKARLVVEDSGIGIPPEHLPHVFERFYRVDKARSRAEGGAGLGLSIVQSIVLTHGGTVEIASQPDAGTRCVVEIPLG